MRCNRSSSSTEQTAVVSLSPFLQSNICRIASGTRIFVQYCPIGANDQYDGRIVGTADPHRAFRALSDSRRPSTLLGVEGERPRRNAENFLLAPATSQQVRLKEGSGLAHLRISVQIH